jgi:predicted nucleic acid-binding protein
LSYLLDTNVISEWVKPQPHEGVIQWLLGTEEDEVFISVISIAEIRWGLERMAPGQRRRRLAEWLEADLPIRFEGRILTVNPAIALEWGVVAEKARRAGLAPGPMDLFLAATARVRSLTMVTRNTKDFRGLELPVVDPWMA